MNEYKILVVEDNDTMRLGIEESLKREGYTVAAFCNGLDAIESLKNAKYDLAVLDIKMEPLNGIQVLEKLKKIIPQCKVLMISAYGSVDDAVNTMQLGASDFLTKPFSPNELRIRVKNLIEKIKTENQISILTEQNNLLNEDIEAKYGNIIGESDSIKQVFNLIDQVSKTDSTILIQGESGTGKELIARAIHKQSNRSEKQFIGINCGVLNENLLESELFGHEKGSFTGAVKSKKGRFELADSGTLFLDEIGDISQSMQLKLLRVLQEGEFERVGGETTIKTDVRIIAATNKNLSEEVEKGEFRSDLYYRLGVIPISLPALRERIEDIPKIAEYFLKKLGEKYKKEKVIDELGFKMLQHYDWPGNIRELENLIERLYVISVGDVIDTSLLNKHLQIDNGKSQKINNGLEKLLFNYEKEIIEKALNQSDGVKNRAAKILGIKTSALYYKLEKFGLLDKDEKESC